MSGDAPARRALCPSAPPELDGAVAIGVMGGTAREPRMTPLEEPLPVTDELLRLAEPVEPTEVFRFAAPCACGGCLHFRERRCRLIERIVGELPPVTDELPECAIRPDCRWWRQEGRAACLRCPRVVTRDHAPSRPMVRAALPVLR